MQEDKVENLNCSVFETEPCANLKGTMLNCIGCSKNITKAYEASWKEAKRPGKDILDVINNVLDRRLNEMEGRGIFRTTICISRFISLLIDKVYNERAHTYMHVTKLILESGLEFNFEIGDSIDQDVIEEMYALIIK